jgi:hypothetical protein
MAHTPSPLPEDQVQLVPEPSPVVQQGTIPAQYFFFTLLEETTETEETEVETKEETTKTNKKNKSKNGTNPKNREIINISDSQERKRKEKLKYREKFI